MLHLDVSNFRSLKNVVLRDNGRLTIVVAYNEAGKSSLCGSIKFAFTGEAFGLKGDKIEGLVTYGEKRLSVLVKTLRATAHRTTSTGDSLKTLASQLGVTPEILPLLFDQNMCGDGGSKQMRAFLNGVGSNRFNVLVAFSQDTAVLPCIEQAIRAGKNDAKPIIKFCEDMRAAQKEPPRPMPPATMEPTEETLATAEANVRQLENQIAEGMTAQGEVRSISSAASSIGMHLKALEEYEVRKKVASVGDPLASRRPSLQKLVGCNDNALTFCYDAMVGAGVVQDVQLNNFMSSILLFKEARRAAQELLDGTPLPPSMPIMPALPPSAKPLWDKLSVDGKSPTPEQLARITADSATRHAEIEQKLALDRHALAQQKAIAVDGRRSQGTWMAYRNGQPTYEQDVLNAQTAWRQWDHAAKIIAERETEYLNTSADLFATIVSDMGIDVLQGRKLRIDRERGVFLDSTPIEEVSESTKWRMEVCIMAAIGRLLKSPLLLIDGADICDIHNRNALLGFLSKHIVPHFDHCLLTMTALKTLEEEAKLPEGTRGVSKWLLTDGTLKFHSGEVPEAVRPPPPPPSLASLSGGYTPPAPPAPPRAP